MTNVVLSNKKDYKNPSYRSGSNPLWGKKKHSLIIDAQGASNREIQTESGILRFENGVAALPDDSRARDIVQEMNVTTALHPKQFSLVEDKPTVNTDQTHRYHFGWNRTYERAWELAFGRFEDDPEEDEDDESIEQGVGDNSDHRTG